MDWYFFCSAPAMAYKIVRFPCGFGRNPSGGSVIRLKNPSISREQFSLVSQLGRIYYINKSPGNPGLVDGECVQKMQLKPGVHIIAVGDTVMGVGTEYEELCAAVQAQTTVYYMARVGGREVGPWTETQLVAACENGVLGRDSKVWRTYDPEDEFPAADIVDFGQMPAAGAADGQTREKRFTTVDQGAVVKLGENFKCPYCRTVSDIGDVLSVSVSPSLLGDSVLGDGEQSRFAPTSFTDNGLALDAEGGVCTDIACPRCHMAIPQDLMMLEQTVMSVVGTAGAGKSVFLASSMWQCRQMLRRNFGVGFRDLAPLWNSWIRNYEQRLFFQQDDTQLQQIEKTDLQASNISRSVKPGDDMMLLPMPSYFRLDNGRNGGSERCFVVYDCAGEHFLPGADSHSSLVTMHTLSADAILFLFDPSADPRLRPLLDTGKGDAANSAQMQDALLSELAAKSKKYKGNLGGRKLEQPLMMAVSKADMLAKLLPCGMELYRRGDDGMMALDAGALRELSKSTEALLNENVPEVVATAHDISDNVWFIPVSALGHNPMRLGVRPCDIKPMWAELPVVFTLALKGMIPVVNGKLV